MTLKLGLRGLSIVDKISKGSTVIAASTDNPQVPGNGPVLDAFKAQDEKLAGLHAQILALEGNLKTMRTALAAQEKVWDSAFGALGAFTESVTEGTREAVQSAGFGVRRRSGPPQPVDAVAELRVELTQRPGESLLAWKRPASAVAFTVQWSTDPATDAPWKYGTVVTDTKASLVVAEPGQRVWFRVAAHSARGTGPWTLPASRPVL